MFVADNFSCPIYQYVIHAIVLVVGYKKNRTNICYLPRIEIDNYDL